MKFMWFKYLGLAGVTGLVLVSLSINAHQDSPHFRHGLQVFIDPDTGAFQRPARLPEPARTDAPVLAMVTKLFDSNRHREAPSARERGGYQVDLEHYYRPIRQGRQNSGS